MWIHDVLVRNRVGPSVARNIQFFDTDGDGYLTHHEFKTFVHFLADTKWMEGTIVLFQQNHLSEVWAAGQS